MLPAAQGTHTDALPSRDEASAAQSADAEAELASGPRASGWQNARASCLVADRYRVLERIGRGATSVVYRAVDQRTGRELAVQLLSDDHPLRERLRTRFVRTARAVMQVAHPAVVRYFEAGETEDATPYLVMELLRGETLGTYLEREGTLSPALAIELFSQAAAGLTAVHHAGLVHRDVKPDNLFLEGPIGAPCRLKVIDFGLALPVRAASRETSFVAGTLEYISPEQAVCDPVDARSDVYSLGVVMFRALTGELPFDGARRAGLLAHHLVTPAPPPSWLNEALPSGLQTVILTALRKHPDNRYPNMASMLEDLEQVAHARGETLGPRRLVHDPDRYVARGETSKHAARLLGSVLGA